MAPRNSQNESTAASQDDFTEVADNEWDEVESEVQIVLENVGDEFEGTFNGMDVQGNSGIWQAHFTLSTGEDAFINAGYDLRKKLDKVSKGAYVKCIWTDNLDTGQKSPMRIFKVLTRR